MSEELFPEVDITNSGFEWDGNTAWTDVQVKSLTARWEIKRGDYQADITSGFIDIAVPGTFRVSIPKAKPLYDQNGDLGLLAELYKIVSRRLEAQVSQSMREHFEVLKALADTDAAIKVKPTVSGIGKEVLKKKDEI